MADALAGKWIWIWNWRRRDGGDPQAVADRLKAAPMAAIGSTRGYRSTTSAGG